MHIYIYLFTFSFRWKHYWPIYKWLQTVISSRHLMSTVNDDDDAIYGRQQSLIVKPILSTVDSKRLII